MQIINSGGVFSYILEEYVWEEADAERREFWQMKAMLAAQEAGCLYVSIFVQPDQLFSTLEDKRRVRVFTHTFTRPDREEFEKEFKYLISTFVRTGKLTMPEAKTIILKVLG